VRPSRAQGVVEATDKETLAAGVRLKVAASGPDAR
jgi:hypothetical protein